MTDTPSKFTRGKGLLEPFLATMRTRRANRLIPAQLRNGRILGAAGLRWNSNLNGNRPAGCTCWESIRPVRTVQGWVIPGCRATMTWAACTGMVGVYGTTCFSNMAVLPD